MTLGVELQLVIDPQADSLRRLQAGQHAGRSGDERGPALEAVRNRRPAGDVPVVAQVLGQAEVDKDGQVAGIGGAHM